MAENNNQKYLALAQMMGDNGFQEQFKAAKPMIRKQLTMIIQSEQESNEPE